MPPPPAEPFATRIFLGPALRAQPDRRLVKLVREGYETAFEEIVRRYRKPLDRFAAAIVGVRSEDVTQDALSKALLALRGTTMEIELRPWLYRIVRNTALNDLRDGPPLTEELVETIPGSQSAAVEAERREEIGELMKRLRALPEPQRAAIVMRELEGLSHEEIAAALGISGGAARQAIYRARLALRDGLGLLIPLPLLRLLFDHGVEAAGAGGAVAAAGAASAAGAGAGATVGGFGAAGALKVGLATALLAGSIGAGVAMQHDRSERGGAQPTRASAAQLPSRGAGSAFSSTSTAGPGPAVLVDSATGRGHGGSGSGDDDRHGMAADDHRGHGGAIADDDDFDAFPHSGSGSSPGGSSGHGSSHGGHSGSRGDSGGDRSGEGTSGGGSSGLYGSSEPASGSGSGGGEGSHGDSGSGDSGGSGGGGHDGSGPSSEPAPTIDPPPAPEPLPEESGSGSGGSGSGDDGSGGGEGDS
jgi:RNA polymerase sigma factor (sigma-70 family)